MAWGDAFKSAWNKATDVARSAAGAIATGAKKIKYWVVKKASQASNWIKNTVKETADWVKKKSDDVKKWAVKKATEAGSWVKQKVIQTAQTVKKAYKAIKKTFGNVVAGVVTVVCKAKQSVENVIQKGLDGAVKERKKEAPRKDGLSRFFDVVKPSKEKEWKKPYPQKTGWGSKKEPDDGLKKEVKIGVSATSKKHEDRLLYYGDEGNNLQIGSYGYEFKHGVAYNPDKREYTANLVDLTANVTVASWQTKNSFGESNLVTLDTKVDALSLEGKGRVGATWGAEKKEVVAEFAVSADLIKAEATGTINITPKSIWDNTMGRFSLFGKAPDWLDHGISLGAEGEAGLGVGAGGEMGIKEGKLVFGAMAGLGVKLGFKIGIGFK